MLILTRKSGEAIRIGDEVTLKIIEIRGNQVRLGVEAPRDLAVHREEVYALIQNQAPDPGGASPKRRELLVGLYDSSTASGKDPASDT